MYILIVAIVLVLAVVTLITKELKFRIDRRKNPIPASVNSGLFFDSNLRKFLQPPKLIIKRAGIKRGMTVLDLGCGSGAYSTEAAAAVGEEGLVYAADLQTGMLNQLRNKLKKEGNKVSNVKVVKANAEELPFNSDKFDLVFLVDVLQEVPNRKKALSEIRRVLKPKGAVAITEYFMDPDFVFKAQTIRQCEKAGFKKIRTLGGPLHYTALFVKD